jgi:hypothetical protein
MNSSRGPFKKKRFSVMLYEVETTWFRALGTYLSRERTGTGGGGSA